MLEEEELDAVALESERTIEINMFTARDSIEWIWLEKPHYLVPNDKVGEDAFAVIRDAMRAENVVAIPRLVFVNQHPKFTLYRHPWQSLARAERPLGACEKGFG